MNGKLLQRIATGLVVGALLFDGSTARSVDRQPARGVVARAGARAEFRCPPVLITELLPIATDHGTAGYVIDDPGHYVLARDLEVPSTEIGVLIVAGGVTLDLGRHTLSDPTGRATLVKMLGRGHARIRNGELVGGAVGIAATGKPQVTIESVSIQSQPLASSIVVAGVNRLDVLDNSLVGGSNGLSISGARLGTTRIARNEIHALEQGIDAVGVQGATIEENDIVAPIALRVGDKNWILGNTISGGRAQGGALEIEGEANQIRRNTVSVHGARSAVVVRGWFNLLDGNTLRGGTLAVIEVTSGGNRISSNSIHGDSTGIRVSRQYNLIEENRIRGRGLRCAIDFGDSRENVFRRNLIVQAEQAICGEPNIDGGDDIRDSDRVFAERSPVAGINASLGPETLETEGGCIPEDAVRISDWEPKRVGEYDVGLVIDRPGYYVLTRDLVARFIYGVLISAADVTLDLNGHTITTHPGGSASSIIRIAGSSNVTVRNGAVEGGYEGISATGDESVGDGTRLRLERLDVAAGDDSDSRALRVTGVDRIDILWSSLRGVDNAAWILGKTTGTIVASSFTAAESGLHAAQLDGGAIVGNRLRGDESLVVAGSNHIEGNVMTTFVLRAGRNLVLGNIVADGHLEMPVDSEDNIIIGNLIRGGVSIASAKNTIASNTLRETYLSVSGFGHAISNNLIVGDLCGVSFDNDGGHVYRDNVVLGADEGICGATNEDRGGNVLPPPVCGNMVRATQEPCDTWDLAGQSCQSLGFERGWLRCNDACDGFDQSGCSNGENGVLEALEPVRFSAGP